MVDTVSVSIRWDHGAVRALPTDAQVAAAVRQAGEGLARQVAAQAPHHTGAGAASIAAREERPGLIDVGWDPEHYYLTFPEFGTKYQAAQGFAERAFNEYHFE